MYLFRQKRVSRAFIPTWLKRHALDIPEYELIQLSQRLKNGDQSVKDRLCRGYINLAIVIASQYAPSRISHASDLMSEAMVGVAQAMDEIQKLEDTNFTGFVITKIHTRCSNYFNKSDNSLGCYLEKYNRSLNGDHTSIRMLSFDLSGLKINSENSDKEKYDELVEDLKKSAKSFRQIQIVKFFVEGYSQSEVESLIGLTPQQLRRELQEIEFHYNMVQHSKKEAEAS